MADIQAASEWRLISGADVSAEASPGLAQVQNAEFEELLESDVARHITGADVEGDADASVAKLAETLDYAAFLNERFAAQHAEVPADQKRQWLLSLMCVGVGALRAFIQSNVTGPPLPFTPTVFLLPKHIGDNAELLVKLNQAFLTSLTVDGESAYHLTPNIILLVLAKVVLNSPLMQEKEAPQTALWWRLRVNFLHQRILREKTGELYRSIAKDIEALASVAPAKEPTIQGMYKVEKAMVDTYFGNDTQAIKGLEGAATSTGLQYALTGVLGKRTKFQQNDLSQLVVLAKSAGKAGAKAVKPETIDLNDDTLLESISFTKPEATQIHEESDLPAELQNLDPNDQPPLHPLDATILLLFAETIKNTNPEDGITREQMTPYAERVLSHSTNWEVYTLGLLVRSRIEASRSRTVERGVLQLQALVDQVIAETSGDDSADVTTFLPRPKQSESAPVRERLLYIHQLPIPTRWELEAELAAKWTHLGGIKTALEIYERLEMWPEVALCWAAMEREDKARTIVRSQLMVSEDSTEERIPPPPEAPRLWCILGDIDNDIAHYERAWEVSGHRYARAMRSLGRHYIQKNDYEKAAEAYLKSVKIYPLNGPSWFALGCCYLELQHWENAVRAFGRAVNIDDTDAEAWSNLATALLRRETAPEDSGVKQAQLRLEDEEEEDIPASGPDPQKNKKDALRALQHACRLKRDSWRIWDNYLTVAASISPPAYIDVVLAVRHLIELRKDKFGEIAVDTDIVELLVQHIIHEDMQKDEPEGYNPAKRGLPKMVVELVEKDVVPLITTNDRLWKIVARLELWRKKPRAALDAHEKAWRAVSSRVGIYETEKGWKDLVESTEELVNAYESLGPQERTDGLGAGELVAKDWKFKARSVVRGVLGKGKELWSETKGYERLQDMMQDLKQA